MTSLKTKGHCLQIWIRQPDVLNQAACGIMWPACYYRDFIASTSEDHGTAAATQSSHLWFRPSSSSSSTHKILPFYVLLPQELSSVVTWKLRCQPTPLTNPPLHIFFLLDQSHRCCSAAKRKLKLTKALKASSRICSPPDEALQLESRPPWAPQAFLYTRFHLPLLLPSSRLPPILSKPIQAELCKKAMIFSRDFYSHSSLVLMGGLGSLQILNEGHFIP